MTNPYLLAYEHLRATLAVTVRKHLAKNEDIRRHMQRITYVDAEDGSDVKGDGSRKKPYATIEKAIR